MPHPKQIDFGFNVARLSRRLRQAVDAELQAFGLTDATWRPLAYVGRTPEDRQTSIVMTNNFAFGGINTSLILGRV